VVAAGDPKTGQIRRIKLVIDNGGAFKGVAFVRLMPHARTAAHQDQAKSPAQKTAYASAASARSNASTSTASMGR
jgi:hypothetical protein